jgi:serine/threonine protein kinase
VSDDGQLLRKRYRRLELIGRGGMASVYRGRDEALARDVAIKMYPPARDALDAARQEYEVNVVAALSHHSLVTLFDAGVERSDPDRPSVYLIMELIAGSDLQKTIRGTALSARHIAQIGYDIAEGLQYIHHNHVVHRDIKPSNILLVDYKDDGTRARAKLTDFGIARQGRDDDEPRSGATTGTAAYLSPEQVTRGAVGPASDIYSLGLVLLECFTRELAFPGTPVASALARLDRDPAIPDTLAPEWKSALRAMTSRNPADRPSATEIVITMRDLVIAETGRHKISHGFLPENEEARMQAVARYDILDTPPEGAFDRITRLAARILNVPISIVSIVDSDRIWFKSHHGLEIEQIDREPGLCSSAIMHSKPWVVNNARADPRALANPLVASDFGLQFYAGIPLHTHDGYNLGTLCVLDFEPRKLSADELANLEDLAAMVMSELELRLEARKLVDMATLKTVDMATLTLAEGAVSPG